MLRLKNLVVILLLLFVSGCCCGGGNPFSKPNNAENSVEEKASPFKLMRLQKELRDLMMKYQEAESNPNITEEEISKLQEELDQKQQEIREATEELRDSNDPMIKGMFQKMDEAYQGAEDAKKRQEEAMKEVEGPPPGVALNEEELQNIMDNYYDKNTNKEEQPYNEDNDPDFSLGE